MNSIIEKINFKKIIIIYIIISIIIGIGLILFIGSKFQSKIEFIYNYHEISNEFEKNNYNLENIKNKINKISENSKDVVDILILNNENEIIYSSKKSEFAEQNKFILNKKNNTLNNYFINPNYNNITFKLNSKDELIINTILSNFDLEVKKEYEDEIFYETDFNKQEMYLLSYSLNNNTGEKIYFINQINPVVNGKEYIKIGLAIAIFLFMIYWVLLALYVYQDALKSKLSPYLWGGITLITNIAGLIVYIIYKKNNKICFKCGAVQNQRNIYCTYCGTKLDKTCSKCGATIFDKDEYCSKCGEKIKE